MQTINDKAYNQKILALDFDEANIIADVLKTKELVLQSRVERCRINFLNNPNRHNEEREQSAKKDLETVRNFIHHVTRYNDTLKPY